MRREPRIRIGSRRSYPIAAISCTRPEATRQEQWGVSIASLDSALGTPLIERSEWSAQFAPPGYILFVRAGILMAQPFDLDRMAITGEAIALGGDVGATGTGYSALSASHTGVIVHAKNIALAGELRWFDRSGNPAWIDRNAGASTSTSSFAERANCCCEPRRPQIKRGCLVGRSCPQRSDEVHHRSHERSKCAVVAGWRTNCLQKQPSRNVRVLSEAIERDRSGAEDSGPTGWSDRQRLVLGWQVDFLHKHITDWI